MKEKSERKSKGERKERRGERRKWRREGGEKVYKEREKEVGR